MLQGGLQKQIVCEQISTKAGVPGQDGPSRLLLAMHPAYKVFLLGWPAFCQTSVHDHSDLQSCHFLVLKGELTEHKYGDKNRPHEAYNIKRHVFNPKIEYYISHEFNRFNRHHVINKQMAPAVSLHVYFKTDPDFVRQVGQDPVS